MLYYNTLSHKDWELQNSRIWLAKIDNGRGLDFDGLVNWFGVAFWGEKVAI